MSVATTPRASKRTSALEFHQGSMLARVASTYPNLFDDGVVTELVQNAIDSGAKCIWININLHKRSIVVQDDGDGASALKFEQALGRVGKTMKDRDKLGRYGIGLVTPIGKCERFIFTSTTKNDPHGYNQWTFECAEIVEKESDIKIPCDPRPDLVFSRVEGKGTRWRTEMRIERFRKDLRVQRFDRERLTSAIQERFSIAMKRRGTTIFVNLIDEDGKHGSWDIKPREFRGTQLKKVEEFGRASGLTTFELFLSPRVSKAPKGKVLVGESANDFRIDFRTFINFSASEFLSEDAAQALSSGIFEGVISNSMITLRPDRKSFEKNTALAEFCKQIEKWFQEAGVFYIEEVRTAQREERYQAIGTRSMRVIEELCRKSPVMLDLIQTFKVGTRGTGHADTDIDIVGEQDRPSISTHSAGVPREKSSGDEGRGERQDPENDHKMHKPFSVIGPRGKRRLTVRSDSLGLQFAYEAVMSPNLWSLDAKSGVITFNTRHVRWQQAEEGGDVCLMKLQELVAVFALHMEMTPDVWQKQATQFLEDSLESVVFLILNSDKIAGRRTIVHNELKKKTV